MMFAKKNLKILPLFPFISIKCVEIKYHKKWQVLIKSIIYLADFLNSSYAVYINFKLFYILNIVF